MTADEQTTPTNNWSSWCWLLSSYSTSRVLPRKCLASLKPLLALKLPPATEIPIQQFEECNNSTILEFNWTAREGSITSKFFLNSTQRWQQCVWIRVQLETILSPALFLSHHLHVIIIECCHDIFHILAKLYFRAYIWMYFNLTIFQNTLLYLGGAQRNTPHMRFVHLKEMDKTFCALGFLLIRTTKGVQIELLHQQHSKWRSLSSHSAVGSLPPF